MKVHSARSSGHAPVSHSATQIRCILYSAVSPPPWNIIGSSRLLLPFAVFPIALANSDLSGIGSCTNCCGISDLSASLCNSPQYSRHRPAMLCGFVIISPNADWIQCSRGWNFRVREHWGQFLELKMGRIRMRWYFSYVSYSQKKSIVNP